MTIFFDLDGPILDVSERLYLLYKDLLSSYGCLALSKEDYWNFKRDQIPEKEILQKTCKSDIFTDYSSKRLKLIENIEYLKLDKVVKGAKETLEQLKNDYELVLVTNRSCIDKLSWELQYFDIKEYFDTILVAPGGIEPWKVKTDLIEKSNFELKNSVIVGDTEADILAGKNLKINTIAVLNGIRSMNIIKNLKPDHMCNSIVESGLIISRLMG